MRKEILSKKQADIFPNLKNFSNNFGLIGGTAIALHLGHRQSIDFDLASLKKIDAPDIRSKIIKFAKIENVIVDNTNEYTIVADGIKFTFLHYPFSIKFTEKLESVISMSDLETLAAMKAYALGRRAKWKDYVDLYFIAEKFGSMDPIIKKAGEIFGPEFNEKNFRAQLAYFDDIDYSEKIIFMKGLERKDDEIKKKLLEYSL